MTKLFDLLKIPAVLVFLFSILILPNPARSEEYPYLSLASPELKTTTSPLSWWGHLSFSSFKPDGNFTNPTGNTQNFSEASPTFMPRLDLGFETDLNSENPKSWMAGLSAGAAWGVQKLNVTTYQGSLESRLTTIILSLRPSIGRSFMDQRLRASLLGEVGQVQLTQDSSSLRVADNRKVSFTGLGAELGYNFQTLPKVSLTGALYSRKSSDEQSLKLAPVNFELGLKSQW